MSKRRTKRQFSQTDVSSSRIGVVTATIEQLACLMI
jgi:hypothetical protein